MSYEHFLEKDFIYFRKRQRERENACAGRRWKRGRKRVGERISSRLVLSMWPDAGLDPMKSTI